MWIVAYVVSIVLVNIGFSVIPMIDVMGVMFPPTSIAVGFIFVIRDFAQRRHGNHVLPAMACGVAISYFMADPFVAIASAVAFGLSESMDYLTYTLCKYDFRKRVVLSSLISTPVDSFVFLAMIGSFSAAALIIMTISKMLALIVVWKNREM